MKLKIIFKTKIQINGFFYCSNMSFGSFKELSFSAKKIKIGSTNFQVWSNTTKKQTSRTPKWWVNDDTNDAKYAKIVEKHLIFSTKRSVCKSILWVNSYG